MNPFDIGKTSWDPKLILEHCVAHENFSNIIVVGQRKDGSHQWYIANEEISFMSLSFHILNLKISKLVERALNQKT